MYSHPTIDDPYQYPTVYQFRPGDVVEHLLKPGVPAVIVSGPEQGLTGNKYRVRFPGGNVEIVSERNLT
ncbi:MAG TPA: hypothetical protein DEF34_03170 [Desulfotomaculum sp.]|nr:MAG: hypothetical protein JL56_02790 [Desulfotomaculum sp. BICA1-6]HBX22628.1 hypothetical protein [Desulfotomaculum sp.]